jgi:capsular polysaccharide biosynthesis protein
VQESFRRHNAVRQEAYVLRADGHVTIDGASGFAIHAGRIIPSSLAYAYDARLPSCRALASRSRPVVARNVISLRDPYEMNYFHFFNDLIGKMLFVRQHLPDVGDYSFVIADSVYRSRWFQALRSTELFQNAKFIVQRRDDLLVCESAIFVKAPPNQPDFFRSISASARQRFGMVRAAAPQRLMLLRNADATHGRIPGNQPVLATRLRKYGFAAIDPAILPWPEQVAVMRDCRILVGLHGAGMSNLMFRGGGPMTVVELFPRGFSPPHYYWMSEMLGYRYVPRSGTIDGQIDVNDVIETVRMLM